MKNLIIAEKSSVAADIAKALGDFKKAGGYFERDDLIVVGAVGHLVSLKVPKGQDRGSAFPVLPLIPSHFELEPIEKTADKLELILSLIARADVSSVTNACDAGREGELIFRYIYQYAKSAKPIKRMWLQSMTPQAIKDAYKGMQDGSNFENLFDAAACRSESDWLIGINSTRGLSRLNEILNAQRDLLTAGRVQSPALSIVVDRENAIRSFVPRQYWEVVGIFGAASGEYEGKWIDQTFAKGDDDAREDRLFDATRAQAIIDSCQGGKVSSVSETSDDAKTLAPKLFDLTTLQREANRKLGFSAKHTLTVAQSLYETHKVLTYPRTDSSALPEDYLDTAKKIFESFDGTALGDFAKKALDAGYVKFDKRIFDNSKISDHFAIIPTGQQPSGLSDDEQKIFDLVSKRFIAAFYPPALFKKTVRITVVNDHSFKSNGTVLVDPGWMEVNGREATNDKELAFVADGELPVVASVASKANETKPPKRFTEDTLLGAMEAPGKYVDDDDMRDALKARGLGTPATRAAIIEGLLLATEKKAPYLVREGKELHPTDKAMKLIAFLREHGIDELCSPAMTGDWEMRLRHMEKGDYAKAKFMAEINEMVHAIINRLKNQAAASPQYAASKLDTPCPKCGGDVREEGLFFACGGCDFKVWKKISGRAMSKAEVAHMLSTGKSDLLKGFVSKSGKAFDAFLFYSKEADKLEFEFPPRPDVPDSGFKCPSCGKSLRHHMQPATIGKKGYNFWGCTGYPACDKSFKDKGGQPNFETQPAEKSEK